MGRWWRTHTCDRATQLISLELDGELSQLEQTALARHLSGCAGCRAVSVDVGAFTRMLREAPQIEFEREVEHAHPRRSRTRAIRRAGVSLAFAGLLAAAVLGGLVLPGSSTVLGSALTFQSTEQQQRFAAVEVRRLEPGVFVTGPQTRCIGPCAT
jgi:predicted anti-sigma-YlaC factor YlaD